METKHNPDPPEARSPSPRVLRLEAEFMEAVKEIQKTTGDFQAAFDEAKKTHYPLFNRWKSTAAWERDFGRIGE